MSAGPPEKVQRLLDRFLAGRATTSSALRKAILDRAARHEGAGEVPADLREYADKVALDAPSVQDDDIAALKEKGRSEDEIFETTLAASLGAGLLRLERGLSALKRSR